VLLLFPSFRRALLGDGSFAKTDVERLSHTYPARDSADAFVI